MLCDIRHASRSLLERTLDVQNSVMTCENHCRCLAVRFQPLVNFGALSSPYSYQSHNLPTSDMSVRRMHQTMQWAVKIAPYASLYASRLSIPKHPILQRNYYQPPRTINTRLSCSANIGISQYYLKIEISRRTIHDLTNVRQLS